MSNLVNKSCNRDLFRGAALNGGLFDIYQEKKNIQNSDIRHFPLWLTGVLLKVGMWRSANFMFFSKGTCLLLSLMWRKFVNGRIYQLTHLFEKILLKRGDMK